MKADLILAALGFNEALEETKSCPLSKFVWRSTFRTSIKSLQWQKPLQKSFWFHPLPTKTPKAFQVADLNNATLQSYVKAMARVAKREKVGFVNCFHRTTTATLDPLTINGCHLNQKKAIFISEAFFTKGLSGKKLFLTMDEDAVGRRD